jgi:5-methylcytosine-specific restriction endonuclease McrA
MSKGVKRSKINKTVRYSLWENAFGETTIGLCTVCNKNINISNFHAGHIVSVKDTGTDNISNLAPVCSLCNLSMGSQNMHDFKKKYF